MHDDIRIRESRAGDLPRIDALYNKAFPDEDLLQLVRALMREIPKCYSQVATVGDALIGHIIFTPCGLEGRTAMPALLGPLAVAPDWQRKGVGSMLIRAGLLQLENVGINNFCVLGDPNYYTRFGFEPDNQIAPPYPLPEERHGAWQTLGLQRETPPPSGKLIVPQPWCRQALWAS